KMFEKSFAYIISDILSFITIAICFILKVPQIKTLHEKKSARGINLYGLMLELSSYTIMFSYNFVNRYALLSYLEYPIILIQQLILIYLVLLYNNLISKNTLIFVVGYLILASVLAFDMLPRTVLGILVPMCTPIGASSKIVQLFEILRTKDSESVSVLTWFISAFTNLTRIYTIYMDSADFTLLGNFIISTVLSTSVMFAALFYKKANEKLA
ncbi:PQ-loop repeat-containing protein 3-like, partial [Ctenocephalides felis]|uniref:PQ-loop repeat-containing protein 3-like n=1 Tax=Ctenocephalides felis TaxID=7515 RepID=UPI000E6E1DD8